MIHFQFIKLKITWLITKDIGGACQKQGVFLRLLVIKDFFLLLLRQSLIDLVLFCKELTISATGIFQSKSSTQQIE
jgi:hypothetical protein